MSDITVLGPVAYRTFDLARKCEENQGHQHNYDHITVVQAGSLKVFWRKPGEEKERESKVFRAGEFLLVKADVEHRIKATSPIASDDPRAAVVAQIRQLLKDNGLTPADLDPSTKYACVFTHRDHEGVVVQEYEGHLEAYDVKQEEPAGV